MIFGRVSNLLLHLIGFKSVFVLILFSNICISHSNDLNDSENATEFNNELLGNYSYGELYNQTSDSLNESDISTNYTDENNVTQPNLVVTEDWERSDKPDSNQKYFSFTTSDEDICTCDLNSNYCDINCCCDSDCTAEDMKVFSKCHSQALVPDKNYCYQKDIIYRNNTVYKMVKDPESSLFCIIHDNLKEHLRYKELPVLKSHRDLDVLLKYQSKLISSWNEEEEIDDSESSSFKVGSLISIESADKKSKQVQRVWKLPSACFTRMCSCDQEVRYLEDFNSFCSHTITNLKEECQTNHILSADSFTNFCISPISDPTDTASDLSTLIAHSKSTDSTSKPDQCITIHFETDILKPKYSSQTCFNVINTISFIVLHNGHNGIESIHVKLNYKNLSEDDSSFIQRFNVKFEWNNVTDTDQRSGNPGYQIGLPVLTGTNSSITDIGEAFEITPQQLGLSVLDRDADSQCSAKRKVIKFGKNFISSCTFKSTNSDCKSTQEKIMNILLGTSNKQVFVGVFGNANGSNFDDWIEAYHEDREAIQTEETCSIVTRLTINIAYAAVGTVVNPQYKILGVGYHYDRPQVLSCSALCPNFTLSTSVSFFDVTEPAIAHYPKIPTIKANLPSDFFYPFSYGKQAHHVSNLYFVLLMCTIILIR